ncbi:translation initiation factor 2 [Halonotius terrestris]|uniref:Translation initiation factor 2 n=1 Tax=Halonotius terrestris TaxID=2487750 RepID=A0A8J8TB91_9EURY|nr:translation initiation factor 2 [Halonotius terrestris]TQQ80945.1 translation initiation factor 2 [Halonotius terrestris]
MTHVVTTFLKHRGSVLLTRRGPDAETNPGRWDALSAPSAGDSEAAATEARRLVREATGRRDVTLAHAGESVSVTHDGETWTHYPFRFDVSSRDLDDLPAVETTEWTTPTAMVNRETVPGLWAAYQQVAPSPTTIAEDTAHGSAALSIHALEVLRDRAAVADNWREIADVATELQDAQPSMAVLANRVNRVLSGADRTPEAVHDRAIEAIETALTADSEAAETAAARLSGPVATLSWSGTVKDALIDLGEPVTIAESRPDREGIDLAEAVADTGIDVTVTTDAALPSLLATEPFEAVLVGADTILPTGDVVNKAGTRGLALAANAADVPVYVVTARDKVSKDDTFHPEDGPAASIYDGDSDISVANPCFDLTPGELIEGVLTEDGLLDQRGIEVVAAQHRSNTDWLEAGSTASH